MTWSCAHGDGSCPQPRSASGAFPDLCYWHAKIAAGLRSCAGSGCSKPAGHKPPCSSVPQVRRTMSPDAVMTDERIELVRALHA